MALHRPCADVGGQAQDELQVGVDDRYRGREHQRQRFVALPAASVDPVGRAVAGRAAGQPVSQQPGRVSEIADIAAQGLRGASGDLVGVELPAALPVAGDRRRAAARRATRSMLPITRTRDRPPSGNASSLIAAAGYSPLTAKT